MIKAREEKGRASTVKKGHGEKPYRGNQYLWLPKFLEIYQRPFALCSGGDWVWILRSFARKEELSERQKGRAGIANIRKKSRIRQISTNGETGGGVQSYP